MNLLKSSPQNRNISLLPINFEYTLMPPRRKNRSPLQVEEIQKEEIHPKVEPKALPSEQPAEVSLDPVIATLLQATLCASTEFSRMIPLLIALICNAFHFCMAAPKSRVQGNLAFQQVEGVFLLLPGNGTTA